MVPTVIERAADGTICDVEAHDLPTALLRELEPLHVRRLPRSAERFACLDFEAARFWLRLGPGPPVSLMTKRHRIVVDHVAGIRSVTVLDRARTSEGF
ncbi:hypothetical protein [Saccharomonospora iraqiensis]|uniref:hypothetical protein n=1 Tax=Saccharomonospora iraqiensis TaxID=52698 RepID=UPI0002E9F4F0|nr:hypothetical protein [Saccharomonospora iraqiensis]